MTQATQALDLLAYAVDIISYQLEHEVSSMTASQQEFVRQAQLLLHGTKV